MMKPEDAFTGLLSEGVEFYSHQVAGHQCDGKSKLGILRHQNGNILKHIKEDDRRSQRELEFYQKVFQKENTDPLLIELATYLPTFYGIKKIPVGEVDFNFLCLEDICKDFLHPSILDAKIGGKTYDPEADEAKVAYEKSKSLYADILGFRILGMKIYCNDTDVYITRDKKFGKQVTPENVKNVLELLLTKDVCIDFFILSGFLHNLIDLAKWFKKQRLFAFYSSSLLLVYEGTLSLWQKWIEHFFHVHCKSKHHYQDSKTSHVICVQQYLQNTTDYSQCQLCLMPNHLCHKIKSECSLLRIAIIDCAHVFPTSEEDTNYIFGLEKLIHYLKLILNNLKEKIIEKNYHS